MKRFAVLQLSGCSGCEVALLNAEEWLEEYDLAYMTLVMSAHELPEVELLLVTGGVRSEEDLYRLRRAVRRADQVIVVGTCAISGGVANLGNRPEVREVFLAQAEFIIPTVHNVRAIERALRVAAERYINTEGVDMELERAVGRVVRAFDPCIACATH
jgi:coenzyme F420-reducing hydrogenase gamma subunit